MDKIGGSRNSALDVLKGICIIFVIITHYKWTGSERLLFLFPFWIGMAVPSFMVISGYVNAASYEQNDIKKLSEAYKLKLLIKKVIRFTVPFLITFIVEILLEMYRGGSCKIVHNFRIVTSFLSGGLKAGSGSYYYPLMMQFIFVFPIIYFIIKRKNSLGLILCLLGNAGYEILQYSYGMNESCYRLLIFRYILMIAFGCFLYENYEKKFSAIWGWISLVIGFGFIVLFSYGKIKPLFIIYWTSTCWIAGLYILPILTILIKLGIRNGILEKIGRTSYNIFLVQMIYYNYFAEKLYQKIGEHKYALLVNIVVCVMLGMIFHRVESIFTKKIIVELECFSTKSKKWDIQGWLDQRLLK